MRPFQSQLPFLAPEALRHNQAMLCSGSLIGSWSWTRLLVREPMVRSNRDAAA